MHRHTFKQWVEQAQAQEIARDTAFALRVEVLLARLDNR
jgi:hypothetical protein